MNPIIQAAITVKQAEIDKLLTWDKQANIAVSLAVKYADIGRVDVSACTGLLTQDAVLITVWDLKRHDDIVPLIREVRKLHGQPLKEVVDDKDAQRKIWKFEGNLHVQAFFWQREGAICSYVEVGKKEVPVYELRCDGAPVAEENLDAVPTEAPAGA